ncbi:MAG: hypothetical protein R2867_25955 [Caldilineaceae bacterium]
MGQLPRLGHSHCKSPAVDTAVPPATGFATNRAVKTDIGGDNPTIGFGAFNPGVSILNDQSRYCCSPVSM